MWGFRLSRLEEWFKGSLEPLDWIAKFTGLKIGESADESRSIATGDCIGTSNKEFGTLA
jgi:hypothetical protein